MKHIMIELYPPEGTIWRYDSLEDGPIGEWLANVVPALGDDYSRLSHAATIRVWDHK